MRRKMKGQHINLVLAGLLIGSLLFISGTAQAQKGLYIQQLKNYVQQEILSRNNTSLDELPPIELLGLMDFVLRSQSRHVEGNERLMAMLSDAREEFDDALELLKFMTLMADDPDDIEKIETFLKVENSSVRDMMTEMQYGVTGKSLTSLFHKIEKVKIDFDLESFLRSKIGKDR